MAPETSFDCLKDSGTRHHSNPDQTLKPSEVPTFLQVFRSFLISPIITTRPSNFILRFRSP